MNFFNFLRKKKEIPEVQDMPVKEVKQGFQRERGYFPPNPLYKPHSDPEFWMTIEGEYQDNLKEGRWVIKDKSGQEKGYINYAGGRKHGLEKLPNGGYTLYYLGQAVKSNLELEREWKSQLRGLKMAKKGNKENSSKLKELLANGEEKWLEEYSKRYIER